ncbi:MAG: hypothetical protein NTV36_00805 [Candidatus Staskawiczbacteria bacterium]|nr:hypothetical protein [Candidatus Staskawiczbacteria bacterium]
MMTVVLFFSFAGVSAATLQDVKNAADALQEQINQFSAAISVTTSPLIPYVSLKINNSTFSTVSVTSGSNYTLAWTTRNVVSCVASGAWSGSVNGSSTSVGIATVNKTFILTCKNSAGKALLSAVTLNVVPVPVIAPTTVVNPTEDFTIPPNPTSCNPNWKCTSWSAVTYIYYPQIRICTDANNCGITSNKPIESRPATVFVDAKKVDLKINGSDTVINALPNTQVYFNWTRPVPATCWGEDYLGISYSSANSLDSESSILTSSSVGLHKYTLVCRNETGDKKQTADSVYVNVTNNISDPLPILPKEPKLSVNIKANNFDTPIIVNPGDTFNLTWTSEGAGKFSGSCKVYAGNEGLINSEISGSRRINVGDLIGWKRYMIVCSDNQGNTEKDIVSVNVSNSSVSTLDVKDPIILTIEHTTPLPAHYVNAVDSVCWHVISSEPQNCSGKDDLLTVNVNKTDTNGCLIFPDKKPTKDKKYTITCNKGNSWNKITDTVTESIVVPATIGGSSSNTSATNKINLKANGLSGTSSIVSGDTVMLTWFFGIPGSAGDLGTCVASGDWSGNKTLAAYSSDTLPSGLADHVFSNVTSNKIYTLTCTNSKTGEVSTDTVNVNIDQNPSVNLTINGGGKLYSPTSSYYVPVQINWNTSPAIRNCLGQALSSAVNWTRDGSNSNYPSPFIFDQHSGAVTENVNSSNIYTVICSNKGKNCIGGDSNCYNGYQSVIDFVGVSVPAIISQPLIQLSANGSYKLPTGTNVTVPMGGNVTLKWVGTNAYNHTCKAYGDWSGAKSDSGTEIISNITSEKTFTLACDSTTTDASDQPCVGNVNSGCRNTIVSVKVSPFGKFTVCASAKSNTNN